MSNWTSRFYPWVFPLLVLLVLSANALPLSDTGSSSQLAVRGPPAKAPPATKAPGTNAKVCKTKKREYLHWMSKRDVKEAVSFLNVGRDKIGSGFFGSVIALPSAYKGQPAVVKLVSNLAADTNRALEVLTPEAKLLAQVDQLLGWGVDTGHHEGYLIMKKMGVPLAEAKKDAKFPAQTVDALVTQAVARYKSEYGVEHGDLKDKVNYKNVVFRLVSGHWQAELIDWGMAKVVGGQPKAPTTPEIWSWEC